MKRLSILCVTRAEAYAMPFLEEMVRVAGLCGADLVFAGDGFDAIERLDARFHDVATRIVHVESSGFIESVLEEAVSACRSSYVLRLDDDEAASPAMVDWLVREDYVNDPHWKFPRTHLWGDTQHYLANAPLWPDHQTRLSLLSMSGGRFTIHAGSPFGGGTLAPVCVEHHKFLVKTIEERRAIMAMYDLISPGSGTAFAAFNVPEEVYDSLEILDIDHAVTAAVTDAEAPA